jgi:hypothetical protein
MVWSCEEKTNRGSSNAGNWRPWHYGMVLEGHTMADFKRWAIAAIFIWYTMVFLAEMAKE